LTDWAGLKPEGSNPRGIETGQLTLKSRGNITVNADITVPRPCVSKPQQGKSRRVIMNKKEIFARKNENGNYAILFVSDGTPVTQFDDEDGFPCVYPVRSDLSAYWNHPEGIVLNYHDVVKCGIEIEK